jgi:two-component system, OmpR family, response regulator
MRCDAMKTISPKILVIDDDARLRELLVRYLTEQGFQVQALCDSRELDKKLQRDPPHLLVLDLMLPGEDGLSLCRRVRADSEVPIIMLTAKGEEVDRVIGLEMGADDYLAKPFGSRELIARIRAVLRRSHRPPAPSGPPPETPRYRFDRWVLNTDNRELQRDDGVAVPLSTGEYELLLALVERPQRVLSRDQLLDLARGRAAAAFDRSIDTQVSRLRKKLEHDPAEPRIIKTIWGGGYMFAATVSRA